MDEPQQRWAGWVAEFTFFENIPLPLPSLFPDIYYFPS